MKSNLTRVSFALLSAVFILGCQDLGSGPVGPDGLVPQFDKKGTGDCELPGHNVHCHGDDGDTGGDDPGSPFYQYTFTSSVITTLPSTAIGVRGSPSGKQVYLSCGVEECADELLKLSKGLLLDNSDTERDLCFGDGLSTDLWIGHVSPINGGDGLFANFLFRATDIGGDSIGYRLRLFSSEVVGPFPPKIEESVTVAFTTYFIEPALNKEKNACSGAGNLDDFVVPTSIVILGVPNAD